MRTITIIISHLLGALMVSAQSDIGIGTSLPQAKLHVAGNFRVGGITPGSSFLSFDSSNGQFRWNNSNLFVPSNQYIIQHSASAEGLAYSNPQLTYRYQDGTNRFAVDWQTGNGYFNHFLGIGNSSLAPLHMASEISSKTIFFGESSDYNYGIDVNSYRLQIHNDQGPSFLPSRISLGYGSSSNFTENMRIVSNGTVGLGTTAPGAAFDVGRLSGYSTADFYGTQNISHFNYGTNEYTYIRGGKINSKLIIGDDHLAGVGVGIEPADFIDFIYGKLDVGGRMLIRSGGSLATTAGYWVNNTFDNTVGFVGMENDDYVGFFGSGVGWSFGMNTVTGALKFAGSTGTPGTILQSNGISAAPSWVSPNKDVFDNIGSAVSNSPITLTAGFQNIPGLSFTFTNSTQAIVLVRYNIVLTAGSCNIAVLKIKASGTGSFSALPNDNDYTITCGKSTSVNGMFFMKANSGTHTINLQARIFGSLLNATASCSCALTNQMIVQTIRE